MPPESSADRTLPRAAVIAHPGKIDVDELHSAVTQAEAAHGWQPSTWYETTPERLGDVIAREALTGDPRPDLVVAAGGDGTVRAIAEAMAGSDTPLGIVPAGTGNLLARNLGIDVLVLSRAVETAFAGRARRIDLGQVRVERPNGTRDDFAFTVLGGVGVDAGMIANTSDELKARVGWVAYLHGIYRTIVAGAHFTVRVRVDDDRGHTTRAQSVMVGNCGIMPGGVVLLPDADIGDGRLDLCVLRPEGVFGWVQVWGRMLARTLALRHESVTGRRLATGTRPIRALRYEQGAEVTFRLLSGPEEFEIDGEAVGEVVAARLRVDHEALLVRVPTQAQRDRTLEQAVEFSKQEHRRLRRRVADGARDLGARIQRAAERTLDRA